MRFLELLTIVLVITMPLTWLEAHALTKDQAAQQRAEREQALAKMKEAKSTDTELLKPYLNVITLEISKSCRIIKLNCPEFKKLIPYDTTNQKYVGKLTDEKRLKPMLKNPSIIYRDVKETVICLDCPWDIYKNSKHIIIDRPFIYKLNDDRTIVNNTRYEYHDRYIENCAYARTTFDLLNDTINYLKSNCTETDYKEKIAIKPELTKHDISTSKAYKYQKWLAEAKKLKTENCLKSTKC